MKIKVTAGDLRSTFGNVVDYVMTELSSMVEGWETYDIVSRNYVNGVVFWEFHLQRGVGIVATVFIKEYQFDDDTDDEAIVAEAEAERLV